MKHINIVLAHFIFADTLEPRCLSLPTPAFDCLQTHLHTCQFREDED